MGKPDNVEGMARFGIVPKKAFGVPAADLKLIAKKIKRESNDRHQLAADLWETGVHEARLLAALIDDPEAVTSRQMDHWAGDFDNWAICDSTCGHLFSRTTHAYDKASEWSDRDEEFVKRAGIVLIAWLAVHDKKADDAKFVPFLDRLDELSDDDRNYVRKAVNWSLRQIGKRSRDLNDLAIRTADRIAERNTKTARWIASDALRELRSDKTMHRLDLRAR